MFLVPCWADYDDNDVDDFANIKKDRILLVMMMMKMIIGFCKGKIVVWGDYVSAGKVAVAAHWLPPFLRLDWLSKIPNTLKFSGHSFLTIMMMRTKSGLHILSYGCSALIASLSPSWLIVKDPKHFEVFRTFFLTIMRMGAIIFSNMLNNVVKIGRQSG